MSGAGLEKGRSAAAAQSSLPSRAHHGSRTPSARPRAPSRRRGLVGRGGRVRSRAGHPRARVWGRQRARESELPNARLQNRLLAPARPPRSVSLCPPTCAPPVRTHNAGVHHQAPGRPAGWPGGSPGPPDDGGLVGGGRAHQRGGGQPGPAQGKKKKKSSDERERGGGATHPAPRGRLRNAPCTATRID